MRLNALQSGIHAKTLVLSTEDREEFAALAARNIEIESDWFLRRFRRIETELLSQQPASGESDGTNSPSLAAAYEKVEKQLGRLQTRINAAQRNYHRALKELRALERDRPANPDSAPTAQRPALSPIRSPSANPRNPKPDPLFLRVSVSNLPPPHRRIRDATIEYWRARVFRRHPPF